jgi:hypothetical protein
VLWIEVKLVRPYGRSLVPAWLLVQRAKLCVQGGQVLGWFAADRVLVMLTKWFSSQLTFVSAEIRKSSFPKHQNPVMGFGFVTSVYWNEENQP